MLPKWALDGLGPKSNKLSVQPGELFFSPEIGSCVIGLGGPLAELHWWNLGIQFELPGMLVF